MVKNKTGSTKDPGHRGCVPGLILLLSASVVLGHYEIGAAGEFHAFLD
jgi:hypothetical protein